MLRSVSQPIIWDAVLAEAVPTRVQAGVCLRRAGDAPAVYAIVDGKARVYIRTPSGRQATIRYVESGDLIGLSGLFGTGDAYEVEAVTDATVASIGTERFRRLPSERPELGWAYAEEINHAATDAVRTVLSGAGMITARIARHILAVGVEGSDGRVVVHITHQRLAETVGTAREVVTRALKQFRRDGLIEAVSGSIVVVDAQRLRTLAA